VSYHIIFITACRPIRNVLLQYDLKLAPLINSTFNNRVTQSRPYTGCWCVVSVRRRPRSWYDRLAPGEHSTVHLVYSQPGWGPVC